MLRGKFRLSKSGRNITTGNALDSSFRMEFHSEKYPFLVLPITAAFFVFFQEAGLKGFMLTLTSKALSFRRIWQSHEIPHPATCLLPGLLLPPKAFYSSTLSTRPILIQTVQRGLGKTQGDEEEKKSKIFWSKYINKD